MIKLRNIFQDLSLIDFTSEQQQIPNQVGKRRRDDAYYSGKKKKHVIKNQIVVNNHGGLIIQKYV